VGFLRVIPLAFVMIAGPQIVSAIMFATSEKPRANSLAYDAGAILSTVVGTTIAFFVTTLIGAKSSGHTTATGAPWADYVFIVLLALLAVYVYLRRHQTEPPKWMTKLQVASPTFAFRLGLVLFLVMPGDVISMVTVGGYMAAHGRTLAGAIPFFVATALLVCAPLIVILVIGKRAEVVLPKLRDWMNAHSWVVSEVVVVFFLLMELSDVL
jgi:membrane protease YdiL (CAAX protease family)